jgi:cytochrome c oxidase assembly protein subunit 11
MLQDSPDSALVSASDRRPLPPSGHRRLVLRLLLIVAGSIAFTLALVPLYNVLCRSTGLNGRTADGAFQVGGINPGGSAQAFRIDYGRLVTVEFTGTVMPGLPWTMRPLTRSVTVHPGEVQVVKYLVRNLSSHRVEGQAIPGVTPGQAAQYFRKIECFCFDHQFLAPHEEREMAMVFIIGSNLDPAVRELTLAYAFFAVPAKRVIAFSVLPASRFESRS